MIVRRTGYPPIMAGAHTAPRDAASVGRHAAAPALPAVLNQMADVLDDDAVLAAPLVEQHRRLQASEQRASSARRRLRILRAAARRNGWLRWRRALLTILGTGVLAAVFLMAAAAVLYLVPGPLLLVPATLVLVAVVVATRRLRGRPEPRAVTGLDIAAAEAAAASTAARRSRARLAARARHMRGEVTRWCRRHGVPADAEALRQLARQDERRRRHAVRSGAGARLS